MSHFFLMQQQSEGTEVFIRKATGLVVGDWAGVMGHENKSKSAKNQ